MARRAAPGSVVLAAALLLARPAFAGPVDRWNGFIAEASARFDISADWIRRVMRAESGGRLSLDGRPTTSRAGAMGLMQLMPGTWRDMRRAHGLGADPHDPRDNILAGTAYLRAMYRRFGYPGLFAAYNAGPGRYAEHLSTGRRLPPETIAYVAAVTGMPAKSRGWSGRIAADSVFVLARTRGPVHTVQPPLDDRPPESGSLFVPLRGASGQSR